MSNTNQESNRSPRLLTESETAEMLSVSVFCLRKWRRTGRGPAWLKLTEAIGGAVRYDADDLLAYIAARKRGTSTKHDG